MQLLYSNIPPLSVREEQETIADKIKEQLSIADQVDIAVGYISKDALIELDSLVCENNIRQIRLTIGMYYIDGMPEATYHIALKINSRWSELGIGEIRLARSFKYHGKLYCFSKDGVRISAIIGSANLGVLKLDATNRCQYEIAAITNEASEVEAIFSHIQELDQDTCSACIASLKDVPLIRKINTALTGNKLVTQISPSNVEFYKQCKSEVTFYLPLKVPKQSERKIDDGRHFTKSNINVCYAAPRSHGKSRNWYEIQLTVPADIYRTDGYPAKNVPFFVVTDDGYWFKAHTTSDNNKQFSAVGDELIMGRWLKGRLVAAGLVSPVKDTQSDTERAGMITQEILDSFGCDRLMFKKTGQTALDSDGNPLDVWMLSFGAKE